MNFLKRLIDRTRNAQPEPERRTGSWHQYGNITGDRLRIYNATEQKMPLEMNIGGVIYAHLPPFDGEPNTQDELVVGDYVYRRLTMDERTSLVQYRLKQTKREARAHSFRLRPDHELKQKYHAEIAKECGVFQIQGVEAAPDAVLKKV